MIAHDGPDPVRVLAMHGDEHPAQHEMTPHACRGQPALCMRWHKRVSNGVC